MLKFFSWLSDEVADAVEKGFEKGLKRVMERFNPPTIDQDEIPERLNGLALPEEERPKKKGR